MIILIGFLVICLDQLTKYYIQSHMWLGMSIPVIDQVFHITYILNPGAAFGMLEHQTALLIAVALVGLAVFIYYYRHMSAWSLLMRFGIGLMAGGAAGNLIDRVKIGCVVDFIDFRVWPVFNIADMAICVGFGLVILDALYLSRKEDEKN